MDNRFQGPDSVENGGMFSRQKIQQITNQMLTLYGNGAQLRPQDMARCMIDTYRGMNKHFIPTGYELSSFAKVFDRSRKGVINSDDVRQTATRLFLSNQPSQSMR